VDPVQFQVGERPDFLHRRGIAFRQRSAVLEILSILGIRDEYLVELEEVVDDVAVGLAVERVADAVELDEHEDQGCYADAERGRTDNQTCKLDWLLSTRGSQPAKEAGRGAPCRLRCHRAVFRWRTFRPFQVRTVSSRSGCQLI